MLLPQQKFRQIISVLFLLVEWTQPTENVEIIYPAAPLFHKRFGNSSTSAENGGCDCATVEIVTANEPVLRKHGELLGKYSKMESVENSPNGLYNGRPAFEHFSGKFYLYYNLASQGFWAVGEKLGSEVVRLENQGDRFCPYYLKSLWRYADGDLNALVYDTSLRTVCMNDVCSVARCGHQAKCLLENQETGDNSTSPKARCECRKGYKGDAYSRCVPELDENEFCSCNRLIFSTQNPLARDKHENSYGEYFLFDTFDGAPVYQHFAGIEYLYRRDGHWLISDKIGLHEAGMQNQGDDNIQCPYLFRTHWEYADVEQPGWQWVYDFTARLVCPSDPCSMTKCGFHATCKTNNGQAICSCDVNFEGNPYTRCYPKAPANCNCLTLELTSSGPSALAQSDKMGTYHLFGYVNQRPAYQHSSGLDYLYYADGDAWVIGATFGGSRVGVVNFDKTICPYVIQSIWRHSVGGKLEKDPGIALTCTDPRPILNVKTPQDLVPAPSLNTASASITQNQLEETISNLENIDRIDIIPQRPATIFESTTPSASAASNSPTTVNSLANTTTTRSSRPKTISGLNSTICNCMEIQVTSQNKATIDKHGAQLGTYNLIQVEAGRPIYKHESAQQYLYYHPYSGGNWLINTEIGLLYGGIQNSKDVPVCPYLINTMWQYGDSDLGGWVYDSTLRVTCPSDPCSVLKCGFRANCVHDPTPRCVCRDGFQGDPKVRCYPKNISPTCQCMNVLLSSSGQSTNHQRDKMGEYFLWGYYNDKPVYQHVSGLDFLYYHQNNVWGVGPKIGGNSAGLLNFGRSACPYELTTPWEFGTKLKNKKRQMDPLLNLKCLEEVATTVNDPENTPREQAFLNKLAQLAKTATTTTTTTPVPKKMVDFPKDENPGLFKCGMSSDESPHPWQVQVKVLKDGHSRHLCSGVILTEKHILTSASCLVNSPMKHYMIVVGQRDLDILDDWEEEFSIQSIYTHDMFDEETGAHDIAIVKLKQRRGQYINLSSHHIQPVCLPSTYSNILAYNDICDISGWGSWSKSQAGMSLMGQSVNLNQRCDSDLICVENPSSENQKDFTFDDGMPLICRSRGQRAYIKGLHARQLDPCSDGCPRMKFINIKSYLEWINARLTL